jgi:hypothetical protein
VRPRAEADKSHQELLAYGQLLEQGLGRSMCTFNLHHLACQLTRQVKQRGLTYQWLEHWYERFIGVLKQATKYRITAPLRRNGADTAFLVRHSQTLGASFTNDMSQAEFIKRWCLNTVLAEVSSDADGSAVVRVHVPPLAAVTVPVAL